MNWLLNMKLRTFILCFIMVFIFTGVILIHFIEEEPDEHHFTVSEEKIYEQTIEDIPDEINDELFYHDMSDRLTELDDGSYHDFEVDRVQEPVLKAVEYAEKEKLPFVVWWTPFTGETPKIKKCWYGSCLFSNSQQFYNHSLMKAFMFYGTDFNEDHLPLPRKTHHEWALFHEESPKNQPLFFFDDTLQLFNHTATFKQQSSYPISTQYVKSIDYLLKPLKYTVKEKNQIKHDKKLASVVYVQSGCNPPSDRDAYIQELMKYIQIDSYGKCLHNRDLSEDLQNPMAMHKKNFTEYLQQYKFMISFENGICDDYMTEKIFRTLSIGSVPIYKGAPNIREWLPDQRSAIIADDFKSPKELAKFIQHLDNDDEEYMKYLHFKKTGITNKKLNETLNTRQWGVDTVYKMSFITGFECHVCDQIHKNQKLVADGKSTVLHQADVSHYGCPKPKKYDYPSIPGAEDWERDTWVWEYEDAGDRAKVLKEKVLKSMH